MTFIQWKQFTFFAQTEVTERIKGLKGSRTSSATEATDVDGENQPTIPQFLHVWIERMFEIPTLQLIPGWKHLIGEWCSVHFNRERWAHHWRYPLFSDSMAKWQPWCIHLITLFRPYNNIGSILEGLVSLPRLSTCRFSHGIQCESGIPLYPWRRSWVRSFALFLNNPFVCVIPT